MRKTFDPWARVNFILHCESTTTKICLKCVILMYYNQSVYVQYFRATFEVALLDY